MKKILIIGVCLLIMSMPLVSALSLPRLRSRSITTFETFNSFDEEEIPTWATGNVTGKWGIEIINETSEENIIELGNITGYYSDRYVGLISGKIEPYENESNATYFEGIFLGPFILGRIGELKINIEEIGYYKNYNETIFVGIGEMNETEYHWRVLGLKGPIFYWDGEFQKFE